MQLIAYLSCGTMQAPPKVPRPFRKYRRMVSSIYPSRMPFNSDPNSMQRFTFYTTSRADKLDKVGTQLLYNITADLGKGKSDRVEITIQAVNQILDKTETQNINIFASSFLIIVKRLVNNEERKYVLDGLNMFMKYSEMHAGIEPNDALTYRQIYHDLSKRFAQLSVRNTDSDLHLMGLMALGKLVEKISREPDNLDLKYHDSIIPRILTNFTLITTKIAPDGTPDHKPYNDLAKNYLTLICNKSNLQNFKYMLAQTIRFLSVSNQSGEKNYWHLCESGYFELKAKAMAKLADIEQKSGKEHNSCDEIEPEDLLAYDIFRTIYENSHDSLGPLIVPALINHVEEMLRSKGGMVANRGASKSKPPSRNASLDKSANSPKKLPTSVDISRATGIIICVRLLANQITIGMNVGNHVTKLVDMLEWGVMYQPSTARFVDLIMKSILQITKASPAYQRMEVCSLLVGKMSACYTEELRVRLLDAVHQISMNDIICQDSPVAHSASLRIRGQVASSTSTSTIKSTLIPPALIKSVMRQTSKFYGNQRSKLIKVLMNLLCSEKPILCQDQTLPTETELGHLLDGIDIQSNIDSSIDAFSRISLNFFKWLYNTLLLPDNGHAQLIQIYRLVLACLRYFGNDSTLEFNRHVFHTMVNCQVAREKSAQVAAITLAIAYAAVSLGKPDATYLPVKQYLKNLIVERRKTRNRDRLEILLDIDDPNDLGGGEEADTTLHMKINDIVSRISDPTAAEIFNSPPPKFHNVLEGRESGLFHSEMQLNMDGLESTRSTKEQALTDTDSVHSILSRVYPNSNANGTALNASGITNGLSPEKALIYQILASEAPDIYNDDYDTYTRNLNGVRRQGSLDSLDLRVTEEDGDGKIADENTFEAGERDMETICKQIDNANDKLVRDMSLTDWISNL